MLKIKNEMNQLLERVLTSLDKIEVSLDTVFARKKVDENEKRPCSPTESLEKSLGEMRDMRQGKRKNVHGMI